MPRYAVKLEYNGGGFAGWQRQSNGRTIQETVEAALQNLDPDLAFVVAAGRTDSGVHALGQVIHCDLAKGWDPGILRDALNAHLRPQPIAAVAAAQVGTEFSARFSAERRAYLYRMVTRRAPPALEKGYVWHRPTALNVEAMREAACLLVGRHDFTTFRSAHCQAESPVKTLDCLSVVANGFRGGTEIQVRAEARSFLHRQMRSFVGTLERVGAGAIEPQQVKDALQARDRSRCGPVAPACGLYLDRVDYRPDPFNAAAPRRGARPEG